MHWDIDLAFNRRLELCRKVGANVVEDDNETFLLYSITLRMRSRYESKCEKRAMRVQVHLMYCKVFNVRALYVMIC